jgi:hypothetical protein
MPRLLQIGGHFFVFQPIADVSRLFVHIRRVFLSPNCLSLLRQGAYPLLQDAQNQLQATAQSDVAQQLGAVHPLPAHFQGQLLYLLVGDYLKDNLIQVFAGAFSVFSDTPPMVLECPQRRHALGQVVQPKRLPGLQVELQMPFQFFIAPTEPVFEHVSADQNVDGSVGARICFAVQDSETIFGDVHEDPCAEHAGPGTVQLLAHFIGHHEVAIEETGLLLLLIFTKHRPLSCKEYASILSHYVKQCHFLNELTFFRESQ